VIEWRSAITAADISTSALPTTTRIVVASDQCAVRASHGTPAGTKAAISAPT
jgi:hypothetical protein